MSAVISHYTTQYLEEVQKIAGTVDPAKIDRMIQLLRGVREGGGRLFILGVGGSAGNAGHAATTSGRSAAWKPTHPRTTCRS